jgi:hypothetical protein
LPLYPVNAAGDKSRIKRVITGATEIETNLTIFQLITAAPILTSSSRSDKNRHKHWKARAA